jgi:hypothetical protein
LIDWDSQNQYISISSSQENIINVDDFKVQEISLVEQPFIPTFLQFSRNMSVLAAGYAKGSYWLYDCSLHESQAYQSTHDQAIIDGSWNSKRQLALCSENESVSVNKINEDIISRCELHDVVCFPYFLKYDRQMTLIFANRKEPDIYVWNCLNEYSSIRKIGLNH